MATRVLIVEDSPIMQRLLTALISAQDDLKVVGVAQDPFEARDRIKILRPDVITLDVEMPRMNGFELTAKIRSTEQIAQVPVVLVTGLDSREDRERGITAGADAYIVKTSFDQSNLLDVVQRLI